MVIAKVFVYIKQFNGLPREGELAIKEEDLPPIRDGEFLAEAVYLSVDPYMRAYAATVPLGSAYMGSQVAKILESKNVNYPVGRYVVGYFGWRTHTVHDGREPKIPANFPAPMLVPDLKGMPLSYSLGVLGMPGNTAYFGFLEICKPKKGETVVVSGAAGAVDSIVGQIAKIKGCTVIGITGSDAKGKWLENELGFNHFVNYKTNDIDKVLTKVAPQGVDCYFDNIKMEGFVFYRWLDRYSEGIEENLKWLQEGKLKYRETITEGFENTFKAFVSMLKGENFGKAVIKV